jgi:uracil phosphoribosyltransferase
MVATGGSAVTAVRVLLKCGVAEENITFSNLISCEEGLRTFFTRYPKVNVVSAAIDPSLNDSKFLVPGIGDFGDRYFGTT